MNHVAQRDRFLDRVGDEDHRPAALFPQVEEEGGDLGPGERVQRCERFVHQQDAGVLAQGAGKRDPGLHAAGQLGRVGVAKPGQPNPGEQDIGLLGGLGRG